jgi:hypothetical protein
MRVLMRRTESFALSVSDQVTTGLLSGRLECGNKSHGSTLEMLTPISPSYCRACVLEWKHRSAYLQTLN